MLEWVAMSSSRGSSRHRDQTCISLVSCTARAASKHDNVHKNFKPLCIKGPINRVKRRSMEWEEIFANHICSKGFISKIHKELLQLSITTTDSKIVEGLEWTFL